MEEDGEVKFRKFRYAPDGEANDGEFLALDLKEELKPLVITAKGKALLIKDDILTSGERRKIELAREVTKSFEPLGNDEVEEVADNNPTPPTSEAPKNAVEQTHFHQPTNQPGTKGIDGSGGVGPASVPTENAGDLTSSTAKDPLLAKEPTAKSKGKRTNKRKGQLKLW